MIHGRRVSVKELTVDNVTEINNIKLSMVNPSRSSGNNLTTFGK